MDGWAEAERIIKLAAAAAVAAAGIWVPTWVRYLSWGVGDALSC